MRIMKTGEPCPCCGQAIPAMLPVDKRLLASIVAEGLAIQDAVRTVEHGVVEGQEAMTALTPPNEWVSVEERLPKEKQRVIVRCEHVGTSVGWILWGNWMTDIGPDAGKVTHWRPLPAPPAKEDQK